MASNYQIGKEAELKAAQWLRHKYGFDFATKALPVGIKIDGSIAYHNFDLVSPDNQIVAEVKAHTMTASGNVPSAKISDTFAACGMLEKVSAKTKLLILADRQFYQIFRKYSDGKILRQIELVCIADNQPSGEPDEPLSFPQKTGFEDFWFKLAGPLQSKCEIRNWTVKKGFTGENFIAGPVGIDCLIVYPPSALDRIRVPKSDFRLIYDNWHSYLKGKIGRGELAKQSRFTKYTISIFHQYQHLIE